MNHLALVYHLLSPAQKKRGVWIVLLLAMGSLLDFFSLAFFLPLIFLLINPKAALANEQMAWLHSVFGFVDPMYFAFGLTVIALLFIITKTRVNIWLTYRKATYAYDVAGSLSSRAMTRYLQSSYTNFTNTDFTKEMNGIANVPLTFANNIIIPAGTLLSEIIVLALLLTGIALYNIQVFLFLFLIMTPIAVIYRLKRKNIRQISMRIKKIYPLLLKCTLQSVEALPEIRVFRKEAFFKARFNSTYKELGQTLSRDHTAHMNASRTTEVVAALCLCTLIGYAVLSNLPHGDTLMLMSIYAGVSFRAMPSVNRIFAASLQMRSNEHVVNELSEIVAPREEPFEETTARLPFHENIQLSDICFQYDGQPPVLKHASLNIRKGDKIILAGKSGAGKTTLVHLLLRFVKEHEGEIRVDGVPITDSDTLAWRKLIGYVSQSPYVLDGSIAENIAFGVPRDRINLEKVNELVSSMDLQSWVDSLPEKLDTVIGERGAKISGGQRQRLAIARALYNDAEILLLDEITNQLDRETELEVMHTLDDSAFRNKTIVLITHWPELWKSFGNVYELRGKTFERVASQSVPATS